MENDRSAQFMRDVIVRMQRKKGLTGGQRKYVDSLIDQGAPVVHNLEMCDIIEAAIAVPGMETSAQPLSDFRYKLSKGWNLSEKQKVFLDNMLEQANKLRAEGLPVLTEREHAVVRGLLQFASRQNSYYWSHRPGAARACENAKRFYELHNTLTGRQLEYLKGSFKGVVRRYEIPRLAAGSLGYVQRNPAMIVSAPYFSEHSGVLVQDVLVAGEMKTVREDQLGKRRSRA
jgi:hypothetical protein